MEAGKEREAVIQTADRLCADRGYTGGGETAVEARGPGMGEPLEPEKEQLIAAVRQSLARIAAAVGAGRAESADAAVGALLGGVELVLRRELTKGRSARLKELLPSFVFLVTLPIVEHEEARGLAARTSSLLEKALGDARPSRD
jgi:hypothetical protein